MKVVQFVGGLGNQMFQYAFYLSLKKQFKNVKADVSKFETYHLHHGFELENIFPVTLNKITNFQSKLYNNQNRSWLLRKIRRIMNLKNAYYKEQSEFNYAANIYLDNQPRYYEGYWQNEDYFKKIQDELRTDFTFKHPLSGKNLELAHIIQQNNSVSLHVRRGDYVNHSLLGNICNLSYYQSAKYLIDSKVENQLYMIFSNDIDWCKKNLRITNAHYIDWNTGKDSFIDMQLMSLCKHQIIANSSFSWWAAWLNNNPNKIIIAPKKWINDPENDGSSIIPSGWIKI